MIGSVWLAELRRKQRKLQGARIGSHQRKEFLNKLVSKALGNIAVQHLRNLRTTALEEEISFYQMVKTTGNLKEPDSNTKKMPGNHRTNINMKRISVILILLLTILACGLPVKKTPIEIEPPIASTRAAPLLDSTNTLLAEPSATLEPSPLPTETPTPTKTPSPTETRISTATPTFTPIPTYAILRGKVNVERVSCRYGPGWMYLYLYGMLEGVTQDVLGRTDTGTWVLTQAHGDNISCWVKTEFLDLNGDVMSLEVVYPDKYTIPPSNQNYSFPYDVAAVRSGNQVTISWKSDALRPGDEEDADMVIYVIETWTCTDGKVTFKPIGTSYSQVTVIDEAGCNTPSHGRIYFQDKHGFTGPSEIPWP